MLLGDLAERALLACPGTGPEHVDGALLVPHCLEQTVEVVEVGRIGLHAGHIPADQLHGFVQRILPSARDEDVSPFVHEQLRAGQRHAARCTRDHRDLAVELAHDYFTPNAMSKPPPLRAKPMSRMPAHSRA